MDIYGSLQTLVRGFLSKMIPYKDITQAEKIEASLSSEMREALEKWQAVYMNKAAWLDRNTKSLNLGAFIASEIARQVLLEAKVNITGTVSEDGEPTTNPRSEFLAEEVGKFINGPLQLKLEPGLAAGGMVVKPYPRNGHIYFDICMNWDILPIAFDDDGEFSDVIFPEFYQIKDKYYTRLERHTLEGVDVRITQRVYESSARNYLGTRVPIDTVPIWAGTPEEAVVRNAGGQLFGYFRVANANNIDLTSPLGASVYAKALDLLEDADKQYSRLIWEYKGSELAIHVDPNALKPTAGKGRNGKTYDRLPELDERLYRRLNIEKAPGEELFDIFSPAIRDESLVNGLNQILIKIENVVGLSRGSLSDANVEARTATELNIEKQRSYSTVAKNQAALEHCLKQAIRAADLYASAYKLAPEGDYDASFEWDDSIITDTAQQTTERMMLYNAGMLGKAEFREFYFGETPAQAAAAIQAIREEKLADDMARASILPELPRDTVNGPEEDGEE